MPIGKRHASGAPDGHQNTTNAMPLYDSLVPLCYQFDSAFSLSICAKATEQALFQGRLYVIGIEVGVLGCRLACLLWARSGSLI
jgi:hypothetical protein